MSGNDFTVVFVGGDKDEWHDQHRDIELARYHSLAEDHISCSTTVVLAGEQNIRRSIDDILSADLVFVYPHPGLFSLPPPGVSDETAEDERCKIIPRFLFHRRFFTGKPFQFSIFILPKEEPEDLFSLALWENLMGRFIEIPTLRKIHPTDAGKRSALFRSFAEHFNRHRTRDPIWFVEDPVSGLLASAPTYVDANLFEQSVMSECILSTDRQHDIGFDVSFNDVHWVILPFVVPLQECVVRILSQYSELRDAATRGILAERVRRLREQPVTETSVPKRGRNVFAREGDCWRITFEGQTRMVKHSPGMVYIAKLLQHPDDPLSPGQLDDKYLPPDPDFLRGNDDHPFGRKGSHPSARQFSESKTTTTNCSGLARGNMNTEFTIAEFEKYEKLIRYLEEKLEGDIDDEERAKSSAQLDDMKRRLKEMGRRNRLGRVILKTYCPSFVKSPYHNICAAISRSRKKILKVFSEAGEHLRGIRGESPNIRYSPPIEWDVSLGK